MEKDKLQELRKLAEQAQTYQESHPILTPDELLQLLDEIGRLNDQLAAERKAREEQAEAQCAAITEVLEEINRQRTRHPWSDKPTLGYLCEKGLANKSGRKLLARMKRMEDALREIADHRTSGLNGEDAVDLIYEAKEALREVQDEAK